MGWGELSAPSVRDGCFGNLPTAIAAGAVLPAEFLKAMLALATVGVSAATRRSFASRLGAVLLREVAPARWDRLLRASGLAGLLAIALTAMVPVPAVSDATTLFSLAFFINGPYSPLLPTALEPVLLAYGRIYSPVLVAVVVVVAQLLVEYVNYHLYDAALGSQLLRRTRDSRAIQQVLDWYKLAPYLTTVVVALSPLPYWTVRITAPLSHYPISRHLSATALGRLPRVWVYAALGPFLPLSSNAILGAGLGVSILFVVIRLMQGRRIRARI